MSRCPKIGRGCFRGRGALGHWRRKIHFQFKSEEACAFVSELTKLLPGHDEEDGESWRAYRWRPDHSASCGACSVLAAQESKWQWQCIAKSCRVSAFASIFVQGFPDAFSEAERDRSHHLYSNHGSWLLGHCRSTNASYLLSQMEDSVSQMRIWYHLLLVLKGLMQQAI